MTSHCRVVLALTGASGAAIGLRIVNSSNVVQSIQPIGEWTGRSILLSLPENIEDGDRVAVLIQSRDDRHILGAAVR